MIDTGNDERQQTKNKNGNNTKIDGDGSQEGAQTLRGPHLETSEGDGGGNVGRMRRRRRKQQRAGRN